MTSGTWNKETYADGSAEYTLEGGSSSGYSKSKITLSGHAGVNRTLGSVTIHFYTMNGSNIYADAGKLGITAGRDMYLYYTVSTPPSGGGGGGSLMFTPAKLADAKTATVLAKGSHAVQNFAFDIEE